jgi:hypothetical protein
MECCAQGARIGAIATSIRLACRQHRILLAVVHDILGCHISYRISPHIPQRCGRE